MDSHRIICTTCQARLKVKNVASLGQIVACPRCGSMVLVSAPHGLPDPTPPRSVRPVPAANAEVVESLAGGDMVLDAASPSSASPSSASPSSAHESPSDPSVPPVDVAAGQLADAQLDDLPLEHVALHDPLRHAARRWLLWGVAGGTVAISLAAAVYQMWPETPPTTQSPNAIASTVAPPSTAPTADPLAPAAKPDRDLPSAADPPEGDSPEGDDPEEEGRQENAAESSSPDAASTADPAVTEGGGLAGEVVESNRPAEGMPNPQVLAGSDVPAGEPSAGPGEVERAEQPASGEPSSVAPATDPASAAAPLAAAGPAAVSAPASVAPQPEKLDVLAEYADALSGTTREPEAVSAPNGPTVSSPAVGNMVGGIGGEVEQNSPQEKLLRDSIKRRLQLEVVEIAWESGSPLSVLQSLARLAQGGVAVDPAVYHLSDLAGQALPGQSLRETTLDAALQQILTPRQLQYRVEPGYLEIDPLGGDERGIQRVNYRIADLTAGDAAEAEWLLAQVPRLVAPATWNQRGGAARIVLKGEEFEIDQSPRVHWDVLQLLETMRVARGMTLRSRYRPELFQPGVRRALTERDWLQQPVQLQRRPPRAVVDVVTEIARAGHIEVLFDWSDPLVRQQLRQTTTAPIDKRPCEELLRHVLPEALDLRIVGPQLLQVTSVSRMQEQGETQVYAIPEPLRQVPSPTIEQEVTQWLATGLSPAADGLLAAVDPQRQILVVRAPRTSQEKVAEWLDQSATRVAAARVQDRSPVSQSKE